MMDYVLSNLWQLWVVIAILCLILELSTGGFFLLCFSIGAIGAALSAIWGGGVVQTVFFMAISLLCLLFVRPFAKRCLHKDGPVRPTNADALMGRLATVSEPIEAGGFGRVALDGDDWKAEAVGNQRIEKDSRVRVVGRESIILKVEPIK